MVLRTVAGARTGEDVADLRDWLLALEGGPAVTDVEVLSCGRHDEPAAWTFVEADVRAGVARRRCLVCAHSTPLLDSDARWTHPPMWMCSGCGQSIAEVAAGLSMPDGEHVEWVVLAARCVECGRLAGLTDTVVAHRPLAEVRARL